MNNLDELLGRITIEFPIPLTTEEIEPDLINYLRDEISYDISYGFIKRENSFGGNIIRSLDSIIIAKFKINSKSIEFEIPEGHPKLINKITKKIQDYFSQRLK